MLSLLSEFKACMSVVADINECEKLQGLCKGGGVCVNTEGSFTCQCPAGMELDAAGTTCLGIVGLLFDFTN